MYFIFLYLKKTRLFAVFEAMNYLKSKFTNLIVHVFPPSHLSITPPIICKTNVTYSLFDKRLTQSCSMNTYMYHGMPLKTIEVMNIKMIFEEFRIRKILVIHKLSEAYDTRYASDTVHRFTNV